MQMTNKQWFVTGGSFLVAVAAAVAVWALFPKSAVAPLPAVSETPSVETNVVATSSPKAVSTARPAVPSLLSIAKGDTIVSWNFQGAYTGNPEMVTKAEAEIKNFSDLIGKGTSPDVTIYVGIANQYELLGDGKSQYDYLSRAVRADATSGLPWHNLGVLMERLGALETARIVYERATFLQPAFKQWHYAYLEFLTTRMKADTADIEKAYAAAIARLGQDTDIIQMYTEWKNS